MKDLTSNKYGQLTVERLSHVKRYPKQTKSYWLCRCTCGNTKIVRGEHLSANKIASCGCLAKRNSVTHGQSKSSEYRAWLRMKARIVSSDPHKAKYYGAVGMEQRWERYSEFIKDLGNKPTPEHELDRIDPFLPYCKENCRWATRSEQMQNTRRQYKSLSLVVSSSSLD